MATYTSVESNNNVYIDYSYTSTSGTTVKLATGRDYVTAIYVDGQFVRRLNNGITNVITTDSCPYSVASKYLTYSGCSFSSSLFKKTSSDSVAVSIENTRYLSQMSVSIYTSFAVTFYITLYDPLTNEIVYSASVFGLEYTRSFYGYSYSDKLAAISSVSFNFNFANSDGSDVIIIATGYDNTEYDENASINDVVIVLTDNAGEARYTWNIGSWNGPLRWVVATYGTSYTYNLAIDHNTLVGYKSSTQTSSLALDDSSSSGGTYV